MENHLQIESCRQFDANRRRRFVGKIVCIMADDDFNSSDLEFEAPAKPCSWAGAESINAIITSAAGDRISSKKTSKTLISHESSPKINT
jgi:hypothetical protein